MSLDFSSLKSAANVTGWLWVFVFFVVVVHSKYIHITSARMGCYSVFREKECRLYRNSIQITLIFNAQGITHTTFWLLDTIFAEGKKNNNKQTIATIMNKYFWRRNIFTATLKYKQGNDWTWCGRGEQALGQKLLLLDAEACLWVCAPREKRKSSAVSQPYTG